MTPLKLLSYPVHTKVSQNENLTLKYKIRSTLKLEINFLKDGKPIAPKPEFTQTTDPDFKDIHTIILSLKDLKAETDSGNYTISAKNDLASVDYTVQVAVEDRNESQIRTISCTSGKSSKITIKLSGSPLPEMTWLKDDEQVKIKNDEKFKITKIESKQAKNKNQKGSVDSDSAEYTLKIKNISKNDESIFTALAKNGSGTVKNKFRLCVDVDILQEKWNPDIICEEPDYLNETGYNNRQERFADRAKFDMAEFNKCKFKMPKNNTNTKFDNENKPSPNDYFLMEQNPSPDLILIDESEQLVILTAEFNLDPKLINAHSCYWTIDGEIIDYYDNRFTIIKGKEKQQLIIKEMVDQKTTGKYTCYVKGSDEGIAKFELGIAPSRIMLEELDKYEGQGRLGFDKVDPNHNVRNPLECVDEKIIHGMNLTSRIPIKVERIEVEDQPKFRHKLPQETEFSPGEDVIIECEVGSSVIKGYWFKDNQQIKYKANSSERITILEHGKIRKLRIESASEDDSGVYTCTTGEDFTSTEVVICGECEEYRNPSFFRKTVMV